MEVQTFILHAAENLVSHRQLLLNNYLLLTENKEKEAGYGPHFNKEQL